jgi:hypothetical protein
VLLCAIQQLRQLLTVLNRCNNISKLVTHPRLGKRLIMACCIPMHRDDARMMTNAQNACSKKKLFLPEMTEKIINFSPPISCSNAQWFLQLWLNLWCQSILICCVCFACPVKILGQGIPILLKRLPSVRPPDNL